MAKLNGYRQILLLSLVLPGFLTAMGQYAMEIAGVDRPSRFFSDTLRVRQQFPDREACRLYVAGLPGLLQSKGYPSASVDSVRFDSTAASCLIYAGARLTHTYIRTDSIEKIILEQAGLNRRSRSPVSLGRLQEVQQKILGYMENNGYPFAAVKADSVLWDSDTLYAVLKLEKGPLYRIDSIRNYGSASISSGFLQQYLGIRNGSIYRKEKLMDISGRFRELPYLQEQQAWDLSMMGTGSIVNVYLEPKKSSEVNVLVGFLPANDQLVNNKLLVTGEAVVNLKNALGGGETIGVDWQQIQVKSPRLNILFQQPYLFGSPFGMNFHFDLFKKDSSFVNIGMLLGAAYSLSSRQTGSLFIQRLTTNLLSVDTFAVKAQRRLPVEADLSSVNLGVNYEWYTTDYRFNPRRGNECVVSISSGIKQIRKNNAILKLYDASDPEFDFESLYDTLPLKSYQFRVKLKAVRYFPVSRASTIKAGINAGWFQSPAIFRNELFQIGGYKLLRGFDEESIYASSYGTATLEYRYLLGQNSFLSAFADYGVTQNRLVAVPAGNRFLGLGLGMAFETKAGVFNISYAAGKRDDQKFNLRQSKIHLGYVNYF